jgi:multidrug transporter EmrE-like cation transporter
MIFAFISVGLNALAQITIKLLAKSEYSNVVSLLKQWPLYATAILYGVSIVTWFLALRSVPLSVAYPLQALGYVLVTFLAWLVFSEGLGIFQLFALGLIVSGVILMAVASA